MDAVAVELARTSLAVERRQCAEERDVHDDARHDLGDRRAARHSDKGLCSDQRADALGLRRVRRSGLDAARRRARAVGDDRLCPLRGVLQRVLERVSARHAGVGVLSDGNRALDGEDVLAMILFDRLLKVCLECLTLAGAEEMAVLERDLVQHEIRGERCARADERLITARALMPMQPDNDRQRLRLGGLDDLREVVCAQPHERREGHAALEEIPPAEAFCEICLPQALPFVHIMPPISTGNRCHAKDLHPRKHG